MGRRAPRRTGRAYKEVCALDDLYASLARCCGLEVPATLIFDLDRTLAYGTFLRATRFFTRDEREVVRAYERCVFKVNFTTGLTIRRTSRFASVETGAGDWHLDTISPSVRGPVANIRWMRAAKGVQSRAVYCSSWPAGPRGRHSTPVGPLPDRPPA